MKVDFALDPITGDLAFKNNDIFLVSGADHLIQNLKIRMRLFLGEWFLDTEAGLPFYESILVKNPNLPDIDNIIKAQITDTEDVTELLEYISSYDPVLRTYSIQFKVRSIYGDTELISTAFEV